MESVTPRTPQEGHLALSERLRSHNTRRSPRPAGSCNSGGRLVGARYRQVESELVDGREEKG